jgi:hypothetical protein
MNTTGTRRVIEGTITGTGGRGRHMWMNVRTSDGHEYRGTIPFNLLRTAMPGVTVRFRVAAVHGSEFLDPRGAEVTGRSA